MSALTFLGMYVIVSLVEFPSLVEFGNRQLWAFGDAEELAMY